MAAVPGVSAPDGPGYAEFGAACTRLAVLTSRMESLIAQTEVSELRRDARISDHESRIRLVEAQQKKVAGAAAVVGAVAGTVLTFLGGFVLYLLKFKGAA